MNKFAQNYDCANTNVRDVHVLLLSFYLFSVNLVKGFGLWLSDRILLMQLSLQKQAMTKAAKKQPQ